MVKDSWHVLDIQKILETNTKLHTLISQFQYKNKNITLDSPQEAILTSSFSISSFTDLIIVAVTGELITAAQAILQRLNTHYPQVPVIVVHDESICTLKNINTYPINGFIDLSHYSSLQINSLLNLSFNAIDALAAHKNKESSILETELLSLSGSWQWQLSSQQLTWTPGVYHIHDLPEGKPLTFEEALSFYLPESAIKLHNAFNDAITKAQPYDLTLKIKTSLGQIKTVRTTGKIAKKQGKVCHIYGSMFDISNLINASNDIENKRAFIDGIFNGISDVVIVLDEQGTILKANRASTQLLALTKQALLNNNISTLIPLPKPQPHQSYIDVLIASGKYQHISLKDGKTMPVEITISKVNQQDKPIYIALLKNIESQVLAEQTINHLVFTDKITQLGNYQLFAKDYSALLQQKALSHDSICFMQINIEKFFKINFAYGHSFGNQVLCYIAKLLTSIAQQYKGTVYRISGISFVLMLKLNNTHNIQSIINDTLNLFLNEHHLAGKPLDLMPVITLYNESFNKLKYRASEVLTLLESCKQGRDKQSNLTIIDQQYLSKVNRELRIEYRLKRSIEKGTGVYLLYQPQMNVQGIICSAEALVRMEDKNLGVIYPDEFIAIAERTGLIIPLTKWILQQCLTVLDKLNRTGKAIPISVNISANHIVQTDFVDDILSQLAKFNIPPELLMLELTESAFTNDVNSATINMQELSRKNIKFSLDDFGTGYSNLGYLNQLPFSELKIDKIFIDNIVHNKQSKQLLEIIISIAKVRGLKIVAEGVETIAQVNELKKHGIDLYQGYFYSKPITFKQLKAMINSSFNQQVTL